MTDWVTFRSRVRLIMQDDVVDGSGNYRISDEQLLDYLNDALCWAANRHPLVNRDTLVVTDGVATLPDTVFRVMLVIEDKSLDEVDIYPPGDGEFTVIGSSLYVTSDFSTVDVVSLGEYIQVVLDTDLLPIPRWLEEAVRHYVVSLGLSQMAISSGDVSQWDTRSDSGNPEHNPLLQLSRHFEERAEKALSRRQQQ